MPGAHGDPEERLDRYGVLQTGPPIRVEPPRGGRRLHPDGLGELTMRPSPLPDHLPEEPDAFGATGTEPLGANVDAHEVAVVRMRTSVNAPQLAYRVGLVPSGTMPNEKPRTPFGERLTEARLEAGIKSQNELAKLLAAHLGKDPAKDGGNISRLCSGERGKQVEVATIFALADILKVEPRWLWLGTGVKNRNRVDVVADEIANLTRLAEAQRHILEQMKASVPAPAHEHTAAKAVTTKPPHAASETRKRAPRHR